MLRRKVARQINRLPKSKEGSAGGDTNRKGDIHTTSSLPIHHQQKQHQSHDFNAPNPSISSTDSRHSSGRNKNPMIRFLVQFLCFVCIGFLMISYYFESNQKLDEKSSLFDSIINDHDGRDEPILKDEKIISFSTSSSGNSIINMKDDIMKEMKLRLKAMPTPEWPQIDQRIAEAMTSSGLILGVENHTEFNFNHTIVTAYYEFKSKHSVNEYKKWMIGLFQTSDPIIIFVEPMSKWFDVVKELRQHAPTLLVPMKFDELVMSSTFTKEFWDYEHSIDTEAKIHKGSGVYKIWNEKLILIYNAIHLNPFRTNGFGWMDTGYFRQIRDAPEPGTPLIRLDYNSEGVPKEKVLVMHVRNDPLDAVARVNVAGNCFFGTATAFLQFYTNYYTTFWDWISVKNKFIGSDQFVMTETCRRYSSGCFPYFAGRFKSWFSLSAVIMKKKNFTGISPHYLFLENPPESLQKVPIGQRISYCDGAVVPANDAKCK